MSIIPYKMYFLCCFIFFLFEIMAWLRVAKIKLPYFLVGKTEEQEGGGEKGEAAAATASITP